MDPHRSGKAGFEPVRACAGVAADGGLRDPSPSRPKAAFDMTRMHIAPLSTMPVARPPVPHFAPAFAPACVPRAAPRALLAVFATAVAAAVAAAPVRAQDAQRQRTRALAATCAQCHGTDGRAEQREAFARLAGQSSDYLLNQLLAFRNGQRPATIMHQITKGYSEAQLAELANYFSQQK
jgi:cytochrome c553